VSSKINGYAQPSRSYPSRVRTATQELPTSRKVKRRPRPPPADRDHVTLTDSARTLQKIEETVANTPVVDAAKVGLRQTSRAERHVPDRPRSELPDKLLQYERGLK